MDIRRIGLLLTGCSTVATAQVSPVADDPAQPDAVVTARPDDAAAALRACLARKCPPDQDIRAALDQAATQFVNGNYQASRATLYAARKRNARFAKRYPVPVARMFSAIVMVSSHMGDGDAAWSGRLDALGALKAGLPDSDPRVLMGRLDLADGYVFANRYRAALAEYLGTAERARRFGFPTIEGAALLRHAQLLGHMSGADPVGFRKQANAAAAALIDRTDAGLAPYATAARTLQAQLATAGRNADIERTVAAYRPAARTTRPQLLYAPPMELGFTAAAADNIDRSNSGSEPYVSKTALRRLPMMNFDNQWIDVAFEIGADGRVSNVHVQRQSPDLSGGWAKTVTASVAGRRYAPMTITGGGSVARLERYTLMSIYQIDTGTRIRKRSATPRLQAIDLSDTLPG